MNRTLFRSPAAELAATAGLVTSVASFALLHLLMSEAVDPVSTPVSMYALSSPGTVLFPLGAVSLALSCAILAGRGVGLPRQSLVRFLLGSTAVMLVLASLFRSGTPESGLTVAAQIHRYTAGAAFVLLTVAAGLCAVRMRESGASTAVRRALWWVTALASLTFLTTAVNTFLPGLADGGDWRGVPQRVLLVVLSALVGVLIANSRLEAAPRPVPSPRSVGAGMAPRSDAPGAPVLIASKS
ncbi:DUF998 domain-containing protein [Glycomyces tenuis]|uniref:DUF998 domain-containing protein n=1 Tax=Glycomyces tenuis TaxID=58116 RepID=UPI0003FA53CC|nr:DUF998 domain-containing protein [Glycomyces tenuis]